MKASKEQQINDCQAIFLDFKGTWQFKKFMRLPHRIITLFCGNQSFKTSGVCCQYVWRILGRHPVPKKNVVYFECSKRNIDNKAPHGFYSFKDNDVTVKGWEKGTWNIETLPKDGKCPYCGALIVIHQRKGKKIRLFAETLPADKETISKDGTQTAEIKNTVYPELKKWMPNYMIKRDITVRNPAMIISDPWAGLELNGTRNKDEDILIDFASYSQDVQAGAGVQRMSVYFDEEPPKDHWDEQLQRLSMEDGDLILGLTPANQMCFDEETKILTDSGWKFYDEILFSDNLLTYNIENDKLEWNPIIGFYLSEYNGEMISLKQKNFDMLVTSEHKWVVCNTRKENKYLEETGNLHSKHIITRLCSDTDLGEGNKNYEDNILALIGWTASDGTIATNKVCIYQSQTAYPDYCKKIDKLVENYPGLYRKDTWEYGPQMIHGKMWNGHGIECRWNLIYDLRKRILSVFEKDKSLKQDFICSLSKKQLEILFEALIDGDGHRRENGGITFTQTHNERLVENVLLISTLLGKLARKDIVKDKEGKSRHIVRIYADSKRYYPNTHFKSLSVKKINYNGFIWCPTTKNKTVVVQRNGTVSISGNTWSFDALYEKAQIYYRTPKVRDFLNKLEKTNRYKLVETTDSPSPIAVVQSSTHDNPTLSTEVIEGLTEAIDDPDVLATRIYGIHRQVSGRIFKDFDYKIHFLDFDRFFPDGIFRAWNHYRLVDYHSHNRWACVWMAVSPENEAFVWREWNPDPEKVITAMIANEMAIMSGNYKFKFDLIDALAAETQTNTGTSTVEDMNDEFLKLKREGICTGAYWETWDSKGTRGREVVRTRLKYAKECKRPFNNKVKDQGVTRYLPTLWISNKCVEVGRSLKQWRLESWTRSSLNVDKDRKETPSQKWSHFCCCLEAAFKDKRCRSPLIGYKSPSRSVPNYFQGARSRRYG